MTRFVKVGYIQFSVDLWNGDVTLCCADLHGRGIIGNIKNDDIFDLWKGRRLKMFRLQLEVRKKGDNAL